MTRWFVPVARRTAQVVSVAVLVLLPIVALYTHYKEAHAIHDLDEGNWRFAAVRAIDQFVDRNPRRLEMVEQTQGTIWSAQILGVSLSDPLAGAEAIVSSRSFYRPMLWSLLIPVAVSLVLGRVFCGWICPMNTLLEMVDKLRGLLRFAEIRERDVRFSLTNKYVVLGSTLLVVALSGMPFVALFYPPAVMSREVHLLVFGSTVGLGAYVLLAICVIELFVSKRWWCRYICPGGALYSLLGRFRLVRIVRNEDNCVGCGECVRVCQFDLRPMLVQITGMECTNCGSCVRACHDDALAFRFVPPHREFQHSRRPSPPAPKATASTEQQGETPSGDNKETARVGSRGAAVTAILLILLTPEVAFSHHILGLPHYSYKENYPQAPTLEYPASTGPYDVLMTSFPGHPVPGDRTTIAFYVKDRTTGAPYHLPVSLRVLRTSTFGANEVVLAPTIHEPTTNQHKYFVTFPADGEFIAELTMEVEGKPEVIPFLMVAGEPSAAKSIVIAVAASLGAFLLVVRAIRIKRRRVVTQANEASRQTVGAA